MKTEVVKKINLAIKGDRKQENNKDKGERRLKKKKGKKKKY